MLRQLSALRVSGRVREWRGLCDEAEDNATEAVKQATFSFSPRPTCNSAVTVALHFFSFPRPLSFPFLSAQTQTQPARLPTHGSSIVWDNSPSWSLSSLHAHSSA
jgi:hypothetical protein